MAVDPKDDRDDDDEESAGPTRRIPKHLGVRKSLPAVESALDDFIIQAKQKTLDTTEFAPETREQQLRDRVAELEQQLAAAEARAAVAPSVDKERARPWGAILGAFVVGAAAMFALSFVLAPHDTPSQAPIAAPTEPTPVPTAPTPTSTPTSTPPPTPSATPEPAVVEPEPEPAPAPEPKQAPAAQPKQAKPRPSQPSNESTPTRTPAPTPPPPPANGSNGGDLYNPF